jgi:ribosomal protein L37E
MKIPGITPEDIQEALRPGGPMDTVFVLNKCAACGQEVSRSLRWLHEQPHVCAACGGPLDDKPLRSAWIAIIESYQRTLQGQDRLRDPSG